jgi:hypothetical protein
VPGQLEDGDAEEGGGAGAGICDARKQFPKDDMRAGERMPGGGKEGAALKLIRASMQQEKQSGGSQKMANELGLTGR